MSLIYYSFTGSISLCCDCLLCCPRVSQSLPEALPEHSGDAGAPELHCLPSVTQQRNCSGSCQLRTLLWEPGNEQIKAIVICFHHLLKKNLAEGVFVFKIFTLQ